MNPIESERQMQSKIRSTLGLISPVKALNKPKRRVGGPTDGGYVMLDDLDDISVCYSLGVGPDVSWDVELASRGAMIFQYDHTVESVPAAHTNFRWFKTGITHDEALQPDMRRLDTLIQENGHADLSNMILKIDIEGHEWDCLDVLDPAVFDQFQQIVAEFHGLRMLNLDSFRARAHRVFSSIRRSHEVIHVHGNNFGGMSIVHGIPIADCIELSFVNRRYHAFGPCTEVFPTELDTANNLNGPDLFLGSFAF